MTMFYICIDKAFYVPSMHYYVPFYLFICVVLLHDCLLLFLCVYLVNLVFLAIVCLF